MAQREEAAWAETHDDEAAAGDSLLHGMRSSRLKTGNGPGCVAPLFGTLSHAPGLQV